MINRGIEYIIDYCFTTMHAIYCIECVFEIQYTENSKMCIIMHFSVVQADHKVRRDGFCRANLGKRPAPDNGFTIATESERNRFSDPKVVPHLVNANDHELTQLIFELDA